MVEGLDKHKMDITPMWDIYTVFSVYFNDVDRHMDPSSQANITCLET